MAPLGSKRDLEEKSWHVCPHLRFLPLLLGHHCQLVNIHKHHFLAGILQDVKNYKTKILVSLAMQEEGVHSLRWEGEFLHT